MVQVKGLVVQGGLSVGPVRFLRKEAAQAAARRSMAPPGEERRRFEAARGRALVELRHIRTRVAAHLGHSESLIFLVQAMMLEDEEYLQTVYSYLDRAATAEYAVSQAGGELVALFASLESAYMRARATDARDLSHRMERILAGRTISPLADRKAAILVAEELMPSDVTLVDEGDLLGLVTCQGSPESHTSILAHAIGAPALTGVAVDPAWDGHMAVLDGDRGLLIIDPDAETLRQVQPRLRRVLDTLVRTKPAAPSGGGRALPLSALADSPWEVADALSACADGILYRADSLFEERQIPPDEEEQVSEYRSVLQAAEGIPVTFQTLNLGWYRKRSGRRLSRYAIYRLLRTQLRAVLRVSALGPVSLALSGVETAHEFATVRQVAAHCRRELEGEGVPCQSVPLGVAIQTPAAVLNAARLAAEAKFLALDGHALLGSTVMEEVGDYPAVLWMLRRAASAGRRRGCRVILYGNLENYPRALEAMPEMGVDEFAVPPGSLSTVRECLRQLGSTEGVS